jgi:hypothetical protein
MSWRTAIELIVYKVEDRYRRPSVTTISDFKPIAFHSRDRVLCMFTEALASKLIEHVRTGSRLRPRDHVQGIPSVSGALVHCLLGLPAKL